MAYTNLRDFYYNQYKQFIDSKTPGYDIEQTMRNEGARVGQVRAALDSGAIEDNKLYKVGGGYRLKQGKSFVPVFGDAESKYGKATELDFGAQDILKVGYTWVPDSYGIMLNNLKPVMFKNPQGGGVNLYQDNQGNFFSDAAGRERAGAPQGWEMVGGQTYDQALNDDKTSRVVFEQNPDGTVKQDGGKVISGAEALKQQEADRAAYNAKTNEKIPYGYRYTDQELQQLANTNPEEADRIMDQYGYTNTAVVDVSQIPFTKTMNEKQKSGVVNLVNSGRKFSETDAKNFAYATGQANYAQYVGKTGQEIIAAMASATAKPVEPPAGGTAYMVKGGDTLSAIAAKFGTTVADLMAANPDIKNANLIYKNQKLVIPEVKAKENANKGINDIQNDVKETLDKTTNTKNSNLFKDVQKSEEKEEGATVEFKIPSLLEKYKALVNTPDITAEKTRIAELNAKIKDIELQEMKLEEDIKKEVEGEAPTSLIRALVAEKAKAFYPQKLALLNEKTALETKLENDLENVKAEFQLAVKDQENGLNYLKSMAESGAKLTKEQYELADDALGYGKGFAKFYVEAAQKAKNAKTQEEQLDLMTKIINLQTKLPEGKSFEFNGVTYESMSDPNDDIQIFKETDAKTNQEVIIEYNKKTREVKVVNTGVKAKATGTGPTAPASEYFTKPETDGSTGYYFGNPKNPGAAQKITKKQYDDGKYKTSVDDEEVPLTKEKLISYFGEDRLRKAASEAGYTSGGDLFARDYGVGDEAFQEYLASLEKMITMYKENGYSNKEILNKFESD